MISNSSSSAKLYHHLYSLLTSKVTPNMFSMAAVDHFCIVVVIAGDWSKVKG